MYIRVFFLYVRSQYLDGTAQDQIKASFAIFIIQNGHQSISFSIERN